MNLNKDDLQKMLDKAKSDFTGESVLYAAQRKPDRKPHRKRPSLLDEAFSKVIADAEKQRESKQE